MHSCVRVCARVNDTAARSVLATLTFKIIRSRPDFNRARHVPWASSSASSAPWRAFVQAIHRSQVFPSLPACRETKKAQASDDTRTSEESQARSSHSHSPSPLCCSHCGRHALPGDSRLRTRGQCPAWPQSRPDRMHCGKRMRRARQDIDRYRGPGGLPYVPGRGSGVTQRVMSCRHGRLTSPVLW